MEMKGRWQRLLNAAFIALLAFLLAFPLMTAAVSEPAEDVWGAGKNTAELSEVPEPAAEGEGASSNTDYAGMTTDGESQTPIKDSASEGEETFGQRLTVDQVPWEVTSLDIWKDVDEVTAPGYRLTLEKRASETHLEMEVGETREVVFTIEVGAEEAPGDAYHIRGNIFVDNTGDWPADVTAVSDTVWYKAGGPVWIQAPSSITTTVPLGDDAIPTGGTHIYAYEGTFTLPVPLSGVTAMSNLIEITISNKPDPPKPGMQSWTFHSRQDFDKPADGEPGAAVLHDVEAVDPADGLLHEIKSVTINGSPAASLTGPWELDLSAAPYTVVVTKELTAEQAGEYTLNNKAVLDGLEDEVDVEILVKEEEEPGTGGVIGYKFEDLDMDGVLDEGEGAWQGITFELWKDGTKVGETETDALGRFTFTGLEPGEYEVKEVLTAGIINSGPLSQAFSVVEGEVFYLSEPFLNHRIPQEKAGVVEGTKYLDLDGDGLVDETETGLAGVTVRIYRLVLAEATFQGAFTGAGTSWVLVGEVLTSGDGGFVFQDLEAGSYKVEEVVPAGYYPTSDPALYVEIAGGETARVLFLNAPLASIAGTKYLDLDGDGLVDETETGLAGVTIELLDGEGKVLESRVTPAEGTYLFAGLMPGEYTVREIVPEGYTASSPESVFLELVPGEERTVDFLNYVPVAGEVVTPPVPPQVGGGTQVLPATGFAMVFFLALMGAFLAAGVVVALLGALRIARAK